MGEIMSIKEIRTHYETRVTELAKLGLTPGDVDTELEMVGELLAILDKPEITGSQ